MHNHHECSLKSTGAFKRWGPVDDPVGHDHPHEGVGAGLWQWASLLGTD